MKLTVCIDILDDPLKDAPLAHRPALMGTDVAPGIERIAKPEDANFDPTYADQQLATVFKVGN
ncbi:hypothetical protein MesoLjLa_69600 (plasmid) [Mesorhizobium sp. L-2-11]|nr:hypothetical protein MesoLjLa_69600 [Mesorhizobium sp. L-2-11]